MLWFCVDATSQRFTKQMVETLETVKKAWKDVPIIVVLTKSFFPAEDEDNIKMVQDTFLKFAKKTGMPTAIIPVLAQAPKGHEIIPRGIEKLIETTEDNLDDAIRDAEEVVRKYDLKYKRIIHIMFVITICTQRSSPHRHRYFPDLCRNLQALPLSLSHIQDASFQARRMSCGIF